MELAYGFISCYDIFSNVLDMKRSSAKFVAKLLNFEQTQLHMEVAQESLVEVNVHSNLLKRAITDDETWVYGHDVETKAQSFRYEPPLQWRLSDSPTPKNAR